MQPETRFKLRVLKDLKKIKTCKVLKTQERTRRGVPDLIICLKGMYIECELKVDGEVPTPLQFASMKLTRAAGGMAFWTNPTEWKTHFEMLKGL